MMNRHWDFVGLRHQNWVELPRFEELQAGPYFGGASAALAHALAEYHAVPKQDQRNLEERRQCLTALAAWWGGESWGDGLDRVGAWLLQRIKRKAEHISALIQIISEGWHHPEMLGEWHQPELSPANQENLFIPITKHRFVCPERGYFWGDYWQQTLDPCHRYLPHLHRKWQESEGLKINPVPFIIWLEGESDVEHDHWVLYMDSREQVDHQVLFLDGLLCKQSGRPLDCPERQQFLFVINEFGQLLAARSAPHLCHASLSRGRPVMAAGVLQAKAGQIAHIKFESGHYMTDIRKAWRSVRLFDEKGVNWGAKTRITVYDRYRYLSRTYTPRELRNVAS